MAEGPVAAALPQSAAAADDGDVCRRRAAWLSVLRGFLCKMPDAVVVSHPTRGELWRWSGSQPQLLCELQAAAAPAGLVLHPGCTRVAAVPAAGVVVASSPSGGVHVVPLSPPSGAAADTSPVAAVYAPRLPADARSQSATAVTLLAAAADGNAVVAVAAHAEERPTRCLRWYLHVLRLSLRDGWRLDEASVFTSASPPHGAVPCKDGVYVLSEDEWLPADTGSVGVEPDCCDDGDDGAPLRLFLVDRRGLCTPQQTGSLRVSHLDTGAGVVVCLHRDDMVLLAADGLLHTGHHCGLRLVAAARPRVRCVTFGAPSLRFAAVVEDRLHVTVLAAADGSAFGEEVVLRLDFGDASGVIRDALVYDDGDGAQCIVAGQNGGLLRYTLRPPAVVAADDRSGAPAMPAEIAKALAALGEW
eukprot:TRINITY_DN10155_c0_g1_i3.p1 TRINITY_DN10155_c0_g1~~TRINITY_DN10155_c0_g1_i3.p1  ORF type:complete len:458 (+),score=149.56 TRINITY_DN10155_c0_g1_i3:128-1375(+)